jgi:hypothetical protein
MLSREKSVTATAFVVEMPWDLGVPDEYRPRRPELCLPGADGVEGEGVPCWLRFRTVELPTQLPLAASDLAFGDLSGDEASNASEREARAASVQGFVDRPFLVRRTVAVIYVESVGEIRFKSDEMAEALRHGLKALNDFLVSLGVLYNDRIRPISLDELPPLLPVMAARRVGGKFEHGVSQLIQLGGGPSETEGRTHGEMEQVERMMAIVSSEEGLASFYEMIQRAGSARRAGRHREAIIDYGTAGELFTTTMVGVIGERRGMEPSKLANVLEGPFKDRARHLSRLLGLPENPEDEGSPLLLWWMHCYQRRNGIVHRGADSIGPFSEFARMGLVQMVVDVREAMRMDDNLADLAPMIQWGRRIDETGKGESSEPDELPPIPG